MNIQKIVMLMIVITLLFGNVSNIIEADSNETVIDNKSDTLYLLDQKIVKPTVDKDKDRISDALENLLFSQSDNKVMIDLIVAFDHSPDITDINTIEKYGGVVYETWDNLVYAAHAEIPAENIKAYALEKGVILLEENAEIHTCLDFSVKQMRVRPTVWNTYEYSGNSSHAIAILDTGIDDSHPDLSGKIVKWKDFTDDNYNNPIDKGEHGTHCAGIAVGTGTKSGTNTKEYTWSSWFDYYYDPPWPTYVAPSKSGTLQMKLKWDDDFSDGMGEGLIWIDKNQNEVVESGEYITGSTPLTYSASVNSGRYKVGAQANDSTTNLEGFYCQINVPAQSLGDGHNLLTGVAPDCKLAGLKVLNDYGGGTVADSIDAINWLALNAETYSIIAASMSYSGEVSDTEDTAVNNLVSSGIVCVVTAGNDQGTSYVGGPGTAAKAITVGAVNEEDDLTDYSSIGDPGRTPIKPDVLAPGGSFNMGDKIISVDSNDADNTWELDSDCYSDDYRAMAGTSMATPHVSGLAALVADAMGTWQYTSQQALLVKQIILMTSYEIGSAENGDFTPPFNHGGKDNKEGYGRICADAAIEAATMELDVSDNTFSFGAEVYDKKVWARQVELTTGKTYTFSMDVPDTGNYDLYLYDKDPDSNGEPVLKESSYNTGSTDESIEFICTDDGIYYIVAKWRSGSGQAEVTVENDPPVAYDDYYSIAEDGVLLVPEPGVLENDTDEDGDSLTAIKVSDPSNGILTLHANGSFVYTPNPGYSGSDIFTYKANDSMSDSNIATVYIAIIAENDPPTANFSWSANGLEVNFTDESTDTDGYIDSWSWDLGDGNTSTSQNPTHTYSTAGDYQVTLNVTDDDGATDDITKSVTVTMATIIEIYVDDDFTSSTPGWQYDHFDVIQDGIDAVAENGTVYVYNGTYYENVYVNKTIDLIGENRDSTIIDGNNFGYIITLASNNTTIKNLSIQNSSIGGMGVISHGYDNWTIENCNICHNGEAGVELHSQLGNGCEHVTIKNCHIYNNTYVGIHITSDSSNNKIFHNNFKDNGMSNAHDLGFNQWDNGYPSGGNYWDDYTGTDADGNGIGDIPYDIPGGSNQDLYPIGYFHPIANFTYTPINPTTLSVISFTDVSIDPDGIILNWSWDFGDGNISYDQNTTHQYADDGTYTVTLNVTDDDGASDLISKDIVVTLPTSPRNVYGEVHIDNVLAPNGITVKLSFPGQTITNNTYANGNYLMYFMETNYEEGTFSVQYLGVWYPTTPPTVELGDEDEISYNIDLHVTTGGGENNPPVAYDDYYSIAEDGVLLVPEPGVLENDTDEDGDPLTASLISDVSNGVLTLFENGSFEYTPDGDYCGVDSFTYKAFDGIDYSDETAVAITVSCINDPPIITTSDDLTTTENVLYSVDYDATDTDGDILTWYIATNASFLYISSDTGLLSGTPISSDIGSYWVNISVSDGNDGSDFCNFTLVVSPMVNIPPDKPTNPKPSDGATSVSINPTLKVDVSDPNGDTINVSFYNAADDSLIVTDYGVSSGGTASVTWSGRDYLTTYSWYSIANDSLLENKSDTWSFTTKSSSDDGGGGYIPSGPSNEDPIANANGPYIGVVDEKIIFDGSGSNDKDGTIINYTWNFGDTKIGYGIILTHAYDEPGEYSVILTVTDDGGATDTDETTATISQPNRPPSKPTIDGSINGTKNTKYNYTAVSTDPDNDTIRYSFIWGDQTSYVTEGKFLPSGSVFTADHMWIAAGKYTITVTASDNKTVSEASKYTVYIDAINVGDIGYLADIDGDGIYDSFHNDTSNQDSDVDFDSGKYLIDDDGDGDWNFEYDPDTFATSVYNKGKRESPSEIYALLNALLIGMVLVIIISIIIFFAYRRKRKNNR